MKQAKLKKVIACATIILLIGVTLLYMNQKANTSYEHYIIRWKKSDDILCHYVDTGDGLPSAEDHAFAPMYNSIFFHETSCRGGLNTRQACVVESAARAHPHYQIHVLFSAPVDDFTLKTSCLATLQRFTNVKLSRVHIAAYTKGTPVEDMIAKDVFRESKYHIEHTADLLRFITLYKWGGVYLDTDMLVVKPLDSLGRNWAAREDVLVVNVAAMAIAKDEVGSKLVDAVLREISTSYRPELWIHNGPGALNRVLEKMCSSTNKVDWSAATCNGFEVYEPELIYPVHYSNKNIYFEDGEVKNVTKAYTHHFWNKLTYDMLISKDCPFMKLAKEFCPTIYDMYRDDFGS